VAIVTNRAHTGNGTRGTTPEFRLMQLV
jgi:hypothetical protein